MPEGQVVISGFNTASLWRLRQVFSRKAGAPWDGRFIGLVRLKEWLKLLGLELNGGKFGCYAPPFSNPQWLRRFGFMEKMGPRWLRSEERRVGKECRGGWVAQHEKKIKT